MIAITAAPCLRPLQDRRRSAAAPAGRRRRRGSPPRKSRTICRARRLVGVVEETGRLAGAGLDRNVGIERLEALHGLRRRRDAMLRLVVSPRVRRCAWKYSAWRPARTLGTPRSITTICDAWRGCRRARMGSAPHVGEEDEDQHDDAERSISSGVSEERVSALVLGVVHVGMAGGGRRAESVILILGVSAVPGLLTSRYRDRVSATRLDHGTAHVAAEPFATNTRHGKGFAPAKKPHFFSAGAQIVRPCQP